LKRTTAFPRVKGKKDADARFKKEKRNIRRLPTGEGGEMYPAHFTRKKGRRKTSRRERVSEHMGKTF